MFNFFGATHTKEEVRKRDKEVAREWQRKMKHEMRTIDRQIGKIDREEEKTKKELRAMANKKEIKSTKILAKELVRSRVAKERLLVCKTQMNSVLMSLQQQVSTMKIGEAMKFSTDIMHGMKQVIKLPEFNATMLDMASEMEKMGVIDKVIQDTTDAIDDVDIEDEIELEMHKIFEELAIDTSSMFGGPEKHALAAKKISELKANDFDFASPGL